MLAEAQLKVLRLLDGQFPDPVTIYDEGEGLLALRDADLISQWDMWPDGTRRWVITEAGRRALQQQEGSR